MRSPTITRAWVIVAVISLIVTLLDHQRPIQATVDDSVTLVPQLGHVDFFLYGGLSAVALSPTNQSLATAGGDGSIKFFDVTTGLLERSFSAHVNGVSAIAYSPDGQQLASGGGDGKVRLWNVENGQLLKTLEGHKTPINCLTFSFDGDTVASGSGSYGEVGAMSDNTIRLWNVRTGQPAGVLTGHQASVHDLAFNAEGTLLVSGSLDNTVKIWSARDGRTLRTIPTEATYSLVFSPNGNRIAAAASQRVVFWDVHTGSQIKEIGHSHYTMTVAFTPDWRVMAVANELWDPEKGVKVRSLEKPESGISLALSNDGTLLASASSNTLTLWDLRRSARLHTFHNPPGLTTGLAFSKGGEKLAWGRKNYIYIWNLSTGALHRIIKAHTYNVNEVAFSPDGQLLASCTDTELKIWSVSDGRLLRELSNSIGPINTFQSVQFSPNGKLLAVGGASGDEKGGIGILNATNGRLIRIMVIHPNRAAIAGLARFSHASPAPGDPTLVVHSVGFSSDGGRLVSGDDDANVIVWNVTSGRRMKTMKGHSLRVNSVAFNQSGKRIVSGSFDQTVRIWDAATGRPLRTLNSNDRVTSVRFSPNEQFIVSGSIDRGVRLWTVNDGRQVALLENHEAAVTFVGFSPDGKIAASSSLDGRINLWSTSNKILLSTILGFEDLSWINFSPDGFYNGPPEALNHVAWRVGNRVYPGNRFASEKLNPQRLLALLTGSLPPSVNTPATFSPITALGEVIPVNESEKKLMNDWKDHRFYALIIGNNRYHHLPALETAVKDATELKRILEQRFDFKVKLLLDATRDEIMNELQKHENLPKNSSLLIYYAGHGLYIDFGVQKEGVWQPVDADNTNRSRWIRSGEILESIKLNSALHTLIISDSCFSGTLLNRGNPYVPVNERPEVLFELMKRPSWTLVASGGNEPVADVGEDGHSVFARALLKGLQNIPQNVFTIDYLFHRVLHDEVQEKLRQEPKIRPIPGFEDDGKFIFVRKRR